MTTEKKASDETKAKPDRSKETKLARALDALKTAATAYFDDNDTDTALALRKHHAEISALKGKE